MPDQSQLLPLVATLFRLPSIAQVPREKSWAPIGYLNQRERVLGQELARVILDPQRALLVREMFRIYASGL
ncbi:hypothetical protein BH23ACT12_BH23ACT12_22120 [soil metagenome]